MSRLRSFAFSGVIVAAALGVTPVPSASAADPVIAAAGDIACSPQDPAFNGGAGTQNKCAQTATSSLLIGGGYSAVLDLGDTQYLCGSSSAYAGSYDPSWGQVKPITHPAIGNHEYLTSGASDCTTANAGAKGYFGYFGAAAGPSGKGYYSFDVGAWHFIALNSQCSHAGGCSATSPQGVWLSNDLAAHPATCTLAYWHRPLFSAAYSSTATKPLWTILENAHADVVLAGHDHLYQRFAPQTAAGVADPNGIREFVVGTGGESRAGSGKYVANSVVKNNTTFGVLALTLHATSYQWAFVPVSGSTFTDSGSAACIP